MDFELSDDQEALQQGVRRLLEGRFPMARVRALADQGGVDLDLWRELGDAGVFDRAAAGLGVADAVLVYEELGRTLVPGPLVGTHLAAGVVDGDVVGVVEPHRGAVVVDHLDSLDALVLVDGKGLWRVDPRSLDARPVAEPLDPLTPMYRVDDVPRGEQVGGADDAHAWRLHGGALTAALQLGMALATTELAVAYAKERQQFDRPIGSFQAVKHILADMLVRAEVARAAVYAAGVTLDQPEVGDARRAVAAAKVTAGEAALANGKACVQVHGGMGFTWEVDAHLYLKRAWVLDTVFGSVDHHAEAVAALL